MVQMLVPRSFLYAPALPTDMLQERAAPKRERRSSASRGEGRRTFRPALRERTTTEPIRPTGPAIAVGTPARSSSAEATTTPVYRGDKDTASRSSAAVHDPEALPPAVAALLAITQIPRQKYVQPFRRPNNPRRRSVEELVNEWSTDETLSPSYSNSSSLDTLFEDTDLDSEHHTSKQDYGTVEDGSLSRRSPSEESVPSLDMDDWSITSNGSLPTPDSLQSRKSNFSSRKDKPRSMPATKECTSDHPLVVIHSNQDQDEDLMLSPLVVKKELHPKLKSRVTSNLTTSLNALKNVALSSISTFNIGSSINTTSITPSARSSLISPFPDDVLWSHPHLFPRFSPEIRPVKEDASSTHYLNSTPLIFEEQETPYQQALHGPYLAEPIEAAPSIQMQTYGRARRKFGKRAGLDPRSEAGRALLCAAGVRHREPRENGDFLRIVVMEMNMRRAGKLETGRAKLWLPPRQVRSVSEPPWKVPPRWVGESAY